VPEAPPVIVVTGPTATGKTALAIQIALRIGGEIINADSMQVYRFMNIGTAKPSAEERALVPHHLLDIVTPDAIYSAGRYAEDARAAAGRIASRDKRVVLVGGTGLYIRAFIHGLISGAAADPDLRKELEREHEKATGEDDPHRLHRRLEARDPSAAARIHPNDARRVVRALEIANQLGTAASRVRDEHGFDDCPYRVLHMALDLPKDGLNERIDGRAQEMIDAGLLQEVRDLQDEGYGPELRSMKAIGYRHMLPVAAGTDTLAHAVGEMQRDTRRFARRQRTWLRAVPEAEWFDPSQPEVIFERVDAFLG
jgi:tRNA dimethylallyltransferase